MTGTGLPAYLTRQFALTRPQLATELGAELLSLCQAVTTDGRLAPEEAAGAGHTGRHRRRCPARVFRLAALNVVVRDKGRRTRCGDLRSP
ncbi:MAG: hypothetical protein KBB53_00010, partial [Steroidobacteraceae bacterium]|nr:hypothetical protein [Steroidobacteraceae bacterium]